MTWLTNVGGIPVERIGDVKRSFAKADERPPKGVLHTTEGSWSGSLSVFRYQTGTPTFMVGRDGSTRSGVGYNGKLRIAQFMPIGEMALTLQNDTGGVETNRDCLVQIELVAHCLWTDWLPDPGTVKLLQALFLKLKEVAGIPMKRGGDGTRSTTRWNSNAGWFGHLESPENDHTDPRNIRWQVLLSGGEAKESEVFPDWFAPWKKWYMVGRPKGTPQPTIPGLPAQIPQWAFEDVGDSAEIHRLLGPPTLYQAWRDARLIDTPMPESLPMPIPEWWWEGAVIDHKFANVYADKADDPLQAQLAAKLQEIVVLQNQVASLAHDLEEAQQTDSVEIAELESKLEEVRALLAAALAEIDA